MDKKTKIAIVVVLGLGCLFFIAVFFMMSGEEETSVPIGAIPSAVINPINGPGTGPGKGTGDDGVGDDGVGDDGVGDDGVGDDGVGDDGTGVGDDGVGDDGTGVGEEEVDAEEYDDVPCEVSEWGEWSDCSKSCGGGVKSRERTIKTQAKGNGRKCPTNLVETEDCNMDICSLKLSTGTGYKNAELLLFSENEFKGDKTRINKGEGAALIYQKDKNESIWFYKSLAANKDTKLGFIARKKSDGRPKSIIMNHQGNIRDLNRYFEGKQRANADFMGLFKNYRHSQKVQVFVTNLNEDTEKKIKYESDFREVDQHRLPDDYEIEEKPKTDSLKLGFNSGTSEGADMELFEKINYSPTDKPYDIWIGTYPEPAGDWWKAGFQILEEGDWKYNSMKLREGTYVFVMNDAGSGRYKRIVFLGVDNIPDLPAFFNNNPALKDDLELADYPNNLWVAPISKEDALKVMQARFDKCANTWGVWSYPPCDPLEWKKCLEENDYDKEICKNHCPPKLGSNMNEYCEYDILIV